jgi:hypothetical protein
MENSSETPQKDKSNIEQIYAYTEYRLKLANDSLSALNTKLGSVIAFSGAAISFSINLPNQAFIPDPDHPEIICYSCLILKMTVCASLIVAIYLGIKGFTPQSFGAMTPPKLLMKENYRDSVDDECQLVILKTWLEALEEFEAIRDEKAETTNKAIRVLGFAGFVAATDIMLAALLSMLRTGVPRV